MIIFVGAKNIFNIYKASSIFSLKNKLIFKNSTRTSMFVKFDMTTKVKTVVNDILKPLKDDRLYRGLELNNGMKVLVVSDPKADKSSAALDVNIGAMSDPVDVPGLAHFCEHMLFLGTKKYPAENEYDKYLSEHGGSSNAHTTGENTNYFFDVSPDHFSKALDRFSQFFISPLFTESATSRELNAINSENEKNLKNDARRIHQLEKSLCKPGHDFSKFSTGNKLSLEVVPKEKGINIRNELLNFHTEYYSANIMCLSLVSRESLDTLTEMAVKLFGDVKNKNVQRPVWKDHPFGPNEAKKKLLVVPVKDIRTLSMVWPIPDLQPYYTSNPGHYLGHLIGHEGAGSLLSELKRKGWANALISGEHSGARGFMFFVIDLDLTKEGIEHIEDIVSLAFQYINMLKKEGVKEWIYKECQLLSDIEFKYKDKESPSQFTSRCSSVMQLYPLSEALSAGYYYNNYDPKLIESILNMLTPDMMRLRVVGKKFERVVNAKEKWYGTKYKQEDIPKASIEKWNKAGLNSCFHLPQPNYFIPKDLAFLPVQPGHPLKSENIFKSKFCSLWYCRDDEFKLPKTCNVFQLYSPRAYNDPLSKNYTHLYTVLLKDILNEYAFAAGLAGVTYDIYNNVYGIQITLGGYSEKQGVLLTKILEKLSSNEFQQDRYEIMLEMYTRDLKNFQADQPYNQANYYTSVVMSDVAWTKEELLDNIENMSFEGFKNFIPEFFSQIFIDSLVFGNTSPDKAKELVGMVETSLKTAFKSRPLPSSQQKRLREVQLSDGVHYKYSKENSVQTCSCLMMYLQVGVVERRMNMVLELLCQILAEPCYDVLRTQEQLGYIVLSGLRRANGVQGLRVIVQSNKSPPYVEQRVEAFLQSMETYLKELSAHDFSSHVSSLRVRRLEKAKKMWTQAHKYWSEIFNRLYDFNRDDEEVKELVSITKQDVLNLYFDLIVKGSPKRRMLSVHVVSTESKGQNTPPHNGASSEAHKSIDGADAKPRKEVEVRDLTTFKQFLPLFPLPLPCSVPSKSKL